MVLPLNPFYRIQPLITLTVFAVLCLLACTPHGSSPVGREPQPEIGWTHEFGSPGDDGASSVVVDDDQNVIVGGWTTASLGDSVNAGEHDGFVRKVGPDGTVAWTAMFGSAGEDAVEGLAVDRQRSIYVAGRVTNTLPFQAEVGKGDAFAVVLSPDGEEQWIRQFGTSELDWGESVAVDSEGNVFISGSTAGAFSVETRASLADNYIREFDLDGFEVWTDQIGSDEGNGVTTVVVHKDDNVYVIGSTLGPLPDTTHIGSGDVFVRKYDSTGIKLWTYEYGANDGDAAINATIDHQGNLLVVGSTRGVWEAQARFGGYLDAFLLRINPDGELVLTLQFGTYGSDMASGIVVDNEGNIYIAGRTEDVFRGQRNLGGFDAFVAKFDSAGTALWTRQFGSAADDFAFDVAVDAFQNVYIAGAGHLSSAQRESPANAWVVQFIQKR
ncbi:MAG: SBBP repeat-containing protein [Chloroflexi bacterium]|nr:SBBP repeat-containing protein [Chloroflexota bacterium]